MIKVPVICEMKGDGVYHGHSTPELEVGVDMEEIYPVGQSRSQVEGRILELAESVPIEDSDWPYSQQLHEFVHAWWTLARYYTENEDAVIGVEVVSYYVDFARLLRGLISDSTLDPKLRQQAEDQMRGLDAGMDEVIKEAVSHLNN